MSLKERVEWAWAWLGAWLMRVLAPKNDVSSSESTEASWPSDEAPSVEEADASEIESVPSEKKISRGILHFLVTSRLTSFLVFLAACVLLFAFAWITGHKAGELAAEAIDDFTVGLLPGSQFESIRAFERKFLFGASYEAFLGFVRNGIPWLFMIGAAVYCYRWADRCTHIIGTVDKPAYGILTRVGKAIEVLGPGGLVFTLRPVEGLTKVPTSQYRLRYSIVDGLYSAEGEDGEHNKMSPQPLSVTVGLYFSFPEVNTPYDVPGVDGKVAGRDLLLGMYYSLPGQINLWEGESLRGFLEEAVIGATRQILSQHHHGFARTNKAGIEREIKAYLVSEEANPFRELGIPEVCIDIELISIALREPKTPAEIAIATPEFRRHEASSRAIETASLADATRVKAAGEADATVTEAKGEEAAAAHLRVAKTEALAAYTGAGVSPDVAALVVSGGGNSSSESPSDQLTNLLAVQMLRSGSSVAGRRVRRRPQRGRRQ
ncbi:MAG: hypothetical protein Q7R48_02195 [bacterium]|nr:hypothetical protein [bacterium]